MSLNPPGQDAVADLLLRRLPAEDHALIAPHLELVRCGKGAVLFEPEAPTEYA